MPERFIQGHAWIYGNDVNTDVIFPGKYTYTVQDPASMAQHALEDLDPSFRKNVQRGDIIVAGSNWGCGSSREQAVICLKEIGVSAIIANSFARIYYRNCINNALPAIVCPQIVGAIQKGDLIKIDMQNGEITTSSDQYLFKPLPPSIQEIFEFGGLVEYTRHRLLEPRKGS
jgi:3-isopropylmalate/(R)-2-methylmalate dehydratase small subunit